MFSQLGPLFRTHLRQAEKADTRLEIRRDEQQEHGRKQQDETEDDSGSPLWEDSTAVSVEALKAFLIEFLKSRGDAVPESAASADSLTLSQPHPEYRPPANPRAARAVQAYSSTAAHAPPPMTEPEAHNPASPTHEAAPAVDLVSLLAADEVRTMHALITELDALSKSGVQTLMIEKADTFLEALVLAVRAEKSRG